MDTQRRRVMEKLIQEFKEALKYSEETVEKYENMDDGYEDQMLYQGWVEALDFVIQRMEK